MPNVIDIRASILTISSGNKIVDGRADRDGCIQTDVDVVRFHEKIAALERTVQQLTATGELQELTTKLGPHERCMQRSISLRHSSETM